jgi:hypothetical protein
MYSTCCRSRCIPYVVDGFLLRVYATYALSFRAMFTDMSTAPLTPVVQPGNTTNVPSAYFQHFHMVFPFVPRQVHVDLNRFNLVAEIVD